MKAVLTAAVIVASLAWCGPSHAAPPPSERYADQKVVYHNDGGPNTMSIVKRLYLMVRGLVSQEDVTGEANEPYFQGLLGNIRNHINAVGKDHVQIRVVDHSSGVELFKLANHDKALAAKMDALRADGVRFLICANTLNAAHIDWHQLHGVSEEDIVPSGVAEIARLEGMGYVYIHP
ncbi:DsrE family protein [Roseomonas sp. E05]|uniref:DsrE family protein n=1 Tax=Roseomonas sp. E05 TaxID=3046310 RepID=UPI0024B8C076|nr:DsrE family protein [Roseomonas sp. E05]MDJ0387087.1 DsrE family protein [Roseomonas sp. E05]